MAFAFRSDAEEFFLSTVHVFLLIRCQNWISDVENLDVVNSSTCMGTFRSGSSHNDEM